MAKLIDVDNGSSRMVSSHRFFPESTLGAFYGEAPVEYLDTISGKIVEGECKSLFNCELGWFTEECEENLSTYSEDRYQKLSIGLSKMAKGGKHDFDKKLINLDLIYRFFACQIIRDPVRSGAMLDKVLRSNMAKLDREMDLRSFQNEAVACEVHSACITNVLKESFDSIIVELNRTNTGFVSTNAPVVVDFEGKGSMCIMVANPRVAYCLVSPELSSMLGITELGYSIIGIDEAGATRINECIVKYSKAYEPHIVLGRDGSYLEKLFLDSR